MQIIQPNFCAEGSSRSSRTLLAYIQIVEGKTCYMYIHKGMNNKSLVSSSREAIALLLAVAEWCS